MNNALYIQLSERQQLKSRREKQLQYQRELDQQIQSKQRNDRGSSQKLSPNHSPDAISNNKSPRNYNNSNNKLYSSTFSNGSLGQSNRRVSPNQKLSKDVVLRQLLDVNYDYYKSIRENQHMSKTTNFSRTSNFSPKPKYTLLEEIDHDPSAFKPLTQTKSVFLDLAGKPIRSAVEEGDNQFIEPVISKPEQQSNGQQLNSSEVSQTQDNDTKKKQLEQEDLKQVDTLFIAYKVMNSKRNNNKLRNVVQDNLHRFPLINKLLFEPDSDDPLRRQLQQLSELLGSTVYHEVSRLRGRQTNNSRKRDTQELGDIKDMLKDIESITAPQYKLLQSTTKPTKPKPIYSTNSTPSTLSSATASLAQERTTRLQRQLDQLIENYSQTKIK